VSDIKVEKRGKYGGVKIHLDPEDCKRLIQASEDLTQLSKLQQLGTVGLSVPLKMAIRMGKSIKALLEKEPDLLEDRTPEQVAAILAKEVEKAQMQLNAVKAGTQWQKVDKEELKQALLKHAQ
jgi:hypothetical protein